jgi:hypothetical protein
MLSDVKAQLTIQQIDEKIAQVKQRLGALGPMHPGSLSRQYHVCGKPGCKCQAIPPQRHGPYCKLNYVYHGKFTCRFVRTDRVREVTTLVAAFKTFRQLTDEWIALSIARAQLGPLARMTQRAKSHPPPNPSTKTPNHPRKTRQR